MAKKTISISQIGTYTSCSYKWHLTYVRGVRVKRADISPASLGSAFHIGIAAALKEYATLQDQNWEHSEFQLYGRLEVASDIAIDAWDSENRPENKQSIRFIGEDSVVYADDEAFYQNWQEMVDNAKTLVNRTLHDLDLVGTYRVVTVDNTPLVEFWIEREIPDTEYIFAGIIDLVAENLKTGMTEVIDWKVRNRFASLESEQLSMQVGLYQHVLREQYGVDAVAGVIYQVKNQYPQIPNLNKNGTMSRQKITTDWPTYKYALVEAGLDPADYVDEMQAKLSDVEFYRPLTVVRLPQVTQKLWDNMVEHAHNISNQTEFPRAYGYACRFCPFADLCNAELYDHDTESLFDTKYVLADWAAENSEDEDDEF